METKLPTPQAVLVGIQTPEIDDVAHEASLEELGRLVKTLGYDVAGTVSQKREGTGGALLLGSGKLAELAALTGGTGVVGSMAPPPRSKARERFEGAHGGAQGGTGGGTGSDTLSDEPDDNDDDFIVEAECLGEGNERLVDELDTQLSGDRAILQDRHLSERPVDIHADDSHAGSPRPGASGLHDIYGSALIAQPDKS